MAAAGVGAGRRSQGVTDDTTFGYRSHEPVPSDAGACLGHDPGAGSAEADAATG